MEVKQNPLVSIGVPTFNRPLTLERTLNCLLNQTYSNLEILISDNCSTDSDVHKKINQFIKDKRIKYFRQPVNKGMIFNFNYVYEKATGNLIMRLADDDWIDLNYIESCVNFLINNPDFSAAYGSAKLYNNQNEYVLDDAKINMEQPNASERVKHYFRNILYNGTFYGLVRRENIELLKVTNKLADDWLVVARIAFKGKFKLLENTNCYLTQGGSSQSFENLVRSLKLPGYIKHIPYLTVCVNIVKDILWESSVYKDLNFLKRLKLGLECSNVIWKRYNVRGEIKTILKKSVRYIIKIPSRLYRLFTQKLKLKFKNTSHEQIFTEIYQNNVWGSDNKSNFYSGSGSDYIYSNSYIQYIREYIIENNIKSVIDLGCGDFRIGQALIENLDINYLGIDVVESLINYNNDHFSKPGINFTKLNITRDTLPDGDLCLIRQVLQHLSNKDIKKVLKKAKKYKHLIITEHLPLTVIAKANIDKFPDGDIRYSKGSGVYLDMPPFNKKIQELLRVEPKEHPNSAIVTFKILN